MERDTISLPRNAFVFLRRAATDLGIYYNTGKGSLYKNLYVCSQHCCPGGIGLHRKELEILGISHAGE